MAFQAIEPTEQPAYNGVLYAMLVEEYKFHPFIFIGP
jgi:hypothetical protein